MAFDAEFVSTVLVQVILFFIFISIFFFTYAATTEQKVVKDQLNFLVDQTVGPILGFVCKNKVVNCDKLVNSIDSIDPKSPSIKKNDDKINSSNKAIMMKAGEILLITSVIVLGIVGALFFISKNKNLGFFKHFNINHVLIDSFIILLFVGITEYVFLTYFGSRYITIDVNKVKIALLQKIKDYLYSK